MKPLITAVMAIALCVSAQAGQPAPAQVSVLQECPPAVRSAPQPRTTTTTEYEDRVCEIMVPESYEVTENYTVMVPETRTRQVMKTRMVPSQVTRRVPIQVTRTEVCDPCQEATPQVQTMSQVPCVDCSVPAAPAPAAVAPAANEPRCGILQRLRNRRNPPALGMSI